MPTRVREPERLKRPAVVQLDIDDTLYDYQSCHRAGSSAMEQTAERILGLSRETFRTALSQARKETKARLGPTASSHSRLLYASRSIEHCTGRSQPGPALILEAAYWDTFLENCHLFEGVHDFISIFKEAGIPLCVVTDLTSAIQYRKLVHFGLDASVQWVVTSEEVAGDKETLTPYRLMLEKLALAEEAHIWVFGDSEADLGSVPDRGRATYFLRNNGRNEALESRSDVVFEDFPSVVTLIRSTLQG